MSVLQTKLPAACYLSYLSSIDHSTVDTTPMLIASPNTNICRLGDSDLDGPLLSSAPPLPLPVGWTVCEELAQLGIHWARC